MKGIFFYIVCFVFILKSNNLIALEMIAGLPQRSELNNWEFRKAGDRTWYRAVVPGCTHLSLLENKLIEDPFWGDNEKKLQWIERENWEYKSVFNVAQSELGQQKVLLVFECLDTYADVYLNGHMILKADNMFRTWKVDVKQYLKAEGNELRINFFAVEPIEDKKIKAYSGIELPGGKRAFTRKAQYHYGWDWGPRFVTNGIQGKVYLESYNQIKINDLNIKQVSLADSAARLQAIVEVEALDTVQCELFLNFDQQTLTKSIRLDKGSNLVVFECTVKNPKRWWTNGLGDQFRYEFSLLVKILDQLVDTKTVSTGLRTIELVTDKDDAGETFYFKLNGVPVFMKGANYIPQESFYGRLTDDTYRNLIDQAKHANMNMLRVWGGGLYERDYFYEYCDQAGILVWQDFMYACAMYPADDAMLRNIEQESIEQIKRLRNHPSIALWCGNNEIAEAWNHWGWKQSFLGSRKKRIERDYAQIFQKTLPNLVARYGNGIAYWESSPKFGRGNPLSISQGDAHYWGVWHDIEPFEKFEEKVPRFMSEFGFQSFPSMKTIASFTEVNDRKIDSDAMLNHQKHPRGNALVKEYMMRDYRQPKDFESFVYVSQLLQAEGMRKGFDAHLRNRPYCMGTLYWQLNDCWPVTSWSSIDYFGNWKAMHYFAKHSFQSPTILVSMDEAKKLSVHGINDLQSDVSGKLLVKYYDFSGNLLAEDMTMPVLTANSAKLIYQCDPDVTILDKKMDKYATTMWIGLEIADSLVATRTFQIEKPSALKLEKVELIVEKSVQDSVITLTVKSSKFAKNVYLQSNADGHFSDNFFDVIPALEYKVKFTPRTEQNVDKIDFQIKSLVDTYD